MRIGALEVGGGVMHQEQLFPLIRELVQKHDDQGIMGAVELGVRALKNA